MIYPETVQREKNLFIYTSALEKGDFGKVELILEQADSDPILERQIIEINAVLSQPYGEAAAPAGKGISPAKWWQRIKTSATNVISSPLWRRKLLRTGAAVLGVGIVLFVVASALLGPAVGRVFQNVSSYAPPGRPAAGLPYPTQPPAYAATQTPYLFGQPYPAPTASVQIQQPANRLIVRNGSLSIVARDTRLARQAVMAMMAEFAGNGAFVVSSNETYPYGDQMPVISMTLRVPVKNYDESMNRLAGLGIQVLSRQESANDVTQSYVDVSARIEALQTSRARLLDIIKNAKTTDDLLRAEQELSQREAELEAAKASQQYLAQTAALSSISLELRPAVSSQPVTDPTWNPDATFHNAIHTLLTTLTGLADGSITFAITTLPWLVVVGVIVFGVVRLTRVKRKKQD